MRFYYGTEFIVITVQFHPLPRESICKHCTVCGCMHTIWLKAMHEMDHFMVDKGEYAQSIMLCQTVIQWCRGCMWLVRQGTDIH